MRMPCVSRRCNARESTEAETQGPNARIFGDLNIALHDLARGLTTSELPILVVSKFNRCRHIPPTPSPEVHPPVWNEVWKVKMMPIPVLS